METGISGPKLNDVPAVWLSGTPLLRDKEIAQLSPLTLSFVGDAVFELMVRTKAVLSGGRNVEKLHLEKVKQVNAAAQAALLAGIDERLTNEERDIVRRGRNAKHHSTAKHQTIHDYNDASGLEALCGYLYLKGDTARLQELIGD